MAIVTMILGESGTGKSASMRNLNPEDCLLIQSIKKTLPFRNTWKPANKEGYGIYVTDNHDSIIKAINKTPKDIIIIDDFQYIMANEFMKRAHEKGFEKFTEIGLHAFNVIKSAIELPDNKRVYIISHVEQSDSGKTKIKTIGKMLDEKITLEGMVTTVLKTVVSNGQYFFATQNNGNDTTKSPMGLFSEELIENDLNEVDRSIKEYYNLTETKEI